MSFDWSGFSLTSSGNMNYSNNGSYDNGGQVDSNAVAPDHAMVGSRPGGHTYSIAPNHVEVGSKPDHAIVGSRSGGHTYSTAPDHAMVGTRNATQAIAYHTLLDAKTHAHVGYIRSDGQRFDNMIVIPKGVEVFDCHHHHSHHGFFGGLWTFVTEAVGAVATVLGIMESVKDTNPNPQPTDGSIPKTNPNAYPNTAPDGTDSTHRDTHW